MSASDTSESSGDDQVSGGTHDNLPAAGQAPDASGMYDDGGAAEDEERQRGRQHGPDPSRVGKHTGVRDKRGGYDQSLAAKRGSHGDYAVRHYRK
eukprot:1317467-Pleurochrysis_carterae.AAC.1